MVDLSALQTEILTDPLGLGYSTTDAALTRDLLNEVRTSIQINRTVVATWEILEATVPGEYDAITAAEKERYGIIVSAGEVSVGGTNVRAAFQAMFGPATTTRSNLQALQTRDGSRAEELFGTGTIIKSSHVVEALNL